MSKIQLTCAETPLSWPASVSLDNIQICSTCAIKITAPYPGSLQLTTRRPIGDGVAVDEHNQVSAQYRGQQYTLENAIFHTPGLHVFPGQSAIYPAEYHLHMRTISAPKRYLTLVIPVSHLVAEDPATQAYFASMRRDPRASETRPTLESLLAVLDSKVLQYQGPDLRGRVYDTSGSPVCDSKDERQFLLMLKPAYIRASDLERIPREGSSSIDPRDLPAPGAEPKIKAITLDRLKRTAVIANPGILYNKPVDPAKKSSTLKLLSGNDVVDISGKPVALGTLLGSTVEVSAATPQNTSVDGTVYFILFVCAIIFCSIFGFWIADMIITSLIWKNFFNDTPMFDKWDFYKWNLLIYICFGPIVYYWAYGWF
jgi:hypothetical protein